MSDSVASKLRRPRPLDPYYAPWRGYRLRFWIFWMVWVGLAFAFALGQGPLQRLPEAIRNFLGLAVPFFPFVFFPASVGRWKCPRCAKPFLTAAVFPNVFARKCVHCGLPKWAPEDPDRRGKG